MVDQGAGRKIEGRINWRADVVFLAGEGFKLFSMFDYKCAGDFFFSLRFSSRR